MWRAVHQWREFVSPQSQGSWENWFLIWAVFDSFWNQKLKLTNLRPIFTKEHIRLCRSGSSELCKPVKETNLNMSSLLGQWLFVSRLLCGIILKTEKLNLLCCLLMIYKLLNYCYLKKKRIYCTFTAHLLDMIEKKCFIQIIDFVVVFVVHTNLFKFNFNLLQI